MYMRISFSEGGEMIESNIAFKLSKFQSMVENLETSLLLSLFTNIRDIYNPNFQQEIKQKTEKD